MSSIICEKWSLETRRIKAGEPLWFRFRISVSPMETRQIKYGGLGLYTKEGPRKPSWGGEAHDILKAGDVIDWEDWVIFDSPGKYQCYLGICFLENKDACEKSDKWTILSNPIELVVYDDSTNEPPFLPAGENLLSNGGFENDLEGWSVLNVGAHADFIIEDRKNGARIVKSGDKSLRIFRMWAVSGLILNSRIYREVKLKKGERYLLKASLYGMSGSDIPEKNEIRKIYSEGYVGVAQGNGEIIWSKISLDGEWKEVSLEFLAENDSATIYVGGQIGKEWGANFSNIFIDDVQLFEIKNEVPPAITKMPVFVENIEEKDGYYRVTLLVEKK